MKSSFLFALLLALLFIALAADVTTPPAQAAPDAVIPNCGTMGITRKGTAGNDTQINLGTPSADCIVQSGYGGSDTQYISGDSGDDRLGQDGGDGNDNLSILGGLGNDYISTRRAARGIIF